MHFYTYLWLRADGTPWYVGKGSGDRAWQRCRGHWAPKDSSRILVQDHPSEADSFAAEIFLISHYGRLDIGTGCLRNRSIGGDGVAGLSAETRKKMSDSHKRIGNGLKGKKFAYRARQKSVFASEHLRKMQQEYWKRPEAKVHLQEMQENNRGSHLSIKARHKIRTSRLGKKYPRKKLSIEDQVALEGLRSLCSVD